MTGYDDEARGAPEPAATVSAGGTEQVTNSAGVARFPVGPGTLRVYARKDGRVRSFTERVVVK